MNLSIIQTINHDVSYYSRQAADVWMRARRERDAISSADCRRLQRHRRRGRRQDMLKLLDAFEYNVGLSRVLKRQCSCLCNHIFYLLFFFNLGFL